MRKPIEISKKEAGPIWTTLYREAVTLEFAPDLLDTKAGLCGLKSVITRLIDRTVKVYESDAIELFKKFDPSPAEQAGLDYLRGLVK